MKIAVTGATGLIGQHLIAALIERGDDVVALSRRATNVAGIRTLVWDPATEPFPKIARSSQAVVNLAGTGIGDGRWSSSHRRSILDSRIEVTRRVVEALGTDGPSVLVSGSAIGYYGATGDTVDESSPIGHDFLASICGQWEAEARKGEDRARVVMLRTGIVLSRGGGAFPRMLLPARLGLGGKLGSGKQALSWIHIDDEVKAILYAIDSPGISGAVNAVAPTPVTQREFASALGHALHRPAFVTAPAFALRLALGGPAELALTGQRVRPTVLMEKEFGFQFPDLGGALADLVGPRSRSDHRIAHEVA